MLLQTCAHDYQFRVLTSARHLLPRRLARVNLVHVLSTTSTSGEPSRAERGTLIVLLSSRWDARVGSPDYSRTYHRNCDLTTWKTQRQPAPGRDSAMTGDGLGKGRSSLANMAHRCRWTQPAILREYTRARCRKTNVATEPALSGSVKQGVNRGDVGTVLWRYCMYLQYETLCARVSDDEKRSEMRLMDVGRRAVEGLTADACVSYEDARADIPCLGRPLEALAA